MERTDLDQWRGKEVARLLALVETQRRYYQEIVASLPVAVLVLGSDLSVLLANGAARRIFGLQPGESPRRMDTILPAALLNRIEEVLKTGTAQTGVIVEAGRDRRRVRASIVANRNWDDEAPREALITLEDLSLEALPVSIPLSEEHFIDDIDAIVWAVELPSMKFAFASRQAERLLGFAPQHWTSHPSFWLDRIDGADRDWVAQSYQRAIETGTAHACEFRAITAGGGCIWLREYARVLPAARGRARQMVGVAVDVTERRMLEDQMVQSERVEAVSRLANRMAHDLNNMLMILTGYGEELLAGLASGSTLRADVLEMLAATQRMTGLTGQLLSFTRRQPAAASEMDLESALGKFGPRLSALLGTHVGLDLHLSKEPNRVLADPAQLEQAMTAIVERARQSMHAGQKIVIETTRLEVNEDLRRQNAPLQAGDYAVISVVVPGQPLDAEKKAALFECSLPGKEPWDDVAATLSRTYGIVRQWGGDISVSNGRRSATVFSVFLPRVETPATDAASLIPADSETAPLLPDSPAPLATILVVEDEAGIRALVRKILLRQGYEVLEAANGHDALELSREHGPRVDLLITDVLMPQMGGRELVERLETQGHKLKVLYVSGYTDDATVYAGDLPPGTAFLQKPFTLGSLLDKVKEVLGESVRAAWG